MYIYICMYVLVCTIIQTNAQKKDDIGKRQYKTKTVTRKGAIAQICRAEFNKENGWRQVERCENV